LTITVYHGGLCETLPEVGSLDFSTDFELALARAQRWGKLGRVLEVQIEVDRKRSWRPTDTRWVYFANMAMMRHGHKQFHYSAGSYTEQIDAQDAAIARAIALDPTIVRHKL